MSKQRGLELGFKYTGRFVPVTDLAVCPLCFSTVKLVEGGVMRSHYAQQSQFAKSKMESIANLPGGTNMHV